MPEVTESKLPSVRKIDDTNLMGRVSAVTVKANALVIKDQKGFTEAEKLLTLWKEGRTQIEEIIDGGVLKALNMARQVILDRKTKYLKPVDDAEAIVKRKMSDFEIRKEKERKAEADRMRLEEEQRVERERKALLSKAKKTKDPEKKAQLEHQAGMVQAAPVIPDKAVSKGGSQSRDDVEYEITDPHLFLAFVVNKTNEDVTKIVDFKTGGVKAVIKGYGTKDPIPGLSYKKIKVVSRR